MTSPSDIALFTCTYSGDYDLFEMLCESIDRHASGFQHVVAVPSHDQAKFERFAGPNRQIVSQETFLPSGVFRIPMPPRSWRKKLGVTTRDQYWIWPNRRANGWVIQQIVKFEASRRMNQPIIVHLDSDTILIRDLTKEDFVQDGQARLFRETFDADYAAHKVWAEECARILDLTGEIPSDVHYVGWPVVWHRDVVAALKSRLEERHDADWRHRLMRVKILSEYHVYGLFYEYVHMPKDKHYLSDRKQMILRTFDGSGALTSELDEISGEIGPQTIGCCLQSTLSAGLDARRQVSEKLRKEAQALG